MNNSLKHQLELFAVKERMLILEGIFNAKAGHPGGSLSIAELMAYLYNVEMKVDPANPKWEDRDRFVLSKGHAAPALYATLALKGFFPTEDIKTLRKSDSYLQGHPSMKSVPGVDMSTGSLGQGISTAVGMALAAKYDKKDTRVYTILGDGEIEEGQVWEAAMFASAKKLDNLVVIVDNNNLQIDGSIEEVNSPYPIPEKFVALASIQSKSTVITLMKLKKHLIMQRKQRAYLLQLLQRQLRVRAFLIWKIRLTGTVQHLTKNFIIRQ